MSHFSQSEINNETEGQDPVQANATASVLNKVVGVKITHAVRSTINSSQTG